jgi:uncharacterized protein YegP (UPF0339 family)
VAAKFEIRSPKAGEYSWVLLSQGRTLASGESYTTRASAEKAISAMRQASATATVLDLTLPEAKTPAGATARVVGRALGRAAVKGGRAVEDAEQTVSQAATDATVSAKKTAKKVESAAKKAKAKSKKGKGKGRR